MESNVDSLPGRLRIVCSEIQERIKRILDWHADAEGTKGYVSAWLLEWIGGKRHRCRRRIEKRTDKFKVAKRYQVFVTQIARERTIDGLAISRRKSWRYIREVIEPVIATSFVVGAELWKVDQCMRTDETRCAWIG